MIDIRKTKLSQFFLNKKNYEIKNIFNIHLFKNHCLDSGIAVFEKINLGKSESGDGFILLTACKILRYLPFTWCTLSRNIRPVKYVQDTIRPRYFRRGFPEPGRRSAMSCGSGGSDHACFFS